MNNSNIATPQERFFAHAINCAISVLVLLLVLIPLSSSTDLNAILNSGFNLIILGFIFGVFCSVIMALLTSKLKANPGQLVMGLEVVKRNGSPLSFALAFFRETIGNTLSSSLFGMGYFWIFKKGETQNWHDMIADNVVVTKSNRMLMGIATLAFLVGIIIWQGGGIMGNIAKNIPFYQTIIEDVRQEIENNLPTVPNTQEIFDSEAV